MKIPVQLTGAVIQQKQIDLFFGDLHGFFQGNVRPLRVPALAHEVVPALLFRQLLFEGMGFRVHTSIGSAGMRMVPAE